MVHDCLPWEDCPECAAETAAEKSAVTTRVESNPRPLLIYVAGPYRAKTAWDVQGNIYRARMWGAALARAGAYPVIPHSNTANMDGLAPDELWLGGTLELLCRCDGVILISGWRDSSGSKVEHQTAKDKNIPILDVDRWDERGGANVAADLIEWLRSVKSRAR